MGDVSAPKVDEWRTIPGYSKYEASRDGRIRTKKTGLIAHPEPNPRSGYINKVLVNDEGKYVARQAHVLTALAWLDNPNGLPIVDHINEIRHDNRVENLRWSTYAGNVKRGPKKKVCDMGKRIVQYDQEGNVVRTWLHSVEAAKALLKGTDKEDDKNANYTLSRRIRTCCIKGEGLAGGYAWGYEVEIIEGEIWKDVEFERNGKTLKVTVSDHGRVHLSRNRIARGHITHGYLTVDIDGYNIGIHILVAEAFIPRVVGKPTVDHINRNREDNRACNLVWATSREQALNRGTYDVRSHKRAVIAIDEEGTLWFYESTRAAAEAVGVPESSLKRHLHGEKETMKYGYTWRYATEEEVAQHSA